MKKLIFTTAFVILSFATLRSGAADMYPVTAADRAFFQQVRNAVLTNDAKWFSGAVSYPIVLRSGKAEYKLWNPKELADHAALIFTPHLKAVVQNQSPDSLFKNWQGVMIGNGEIWFSEVAETAEKKKTWVQRIIAINLSTDQSAKVKKGGGQKSLPATKP